MLPKFKDRGFLESILIYKSCDSVFLDWKCKEYLTYFLIKSSSVVHTNPASLLYIPAHVPSRFDGLFESQNSLVIFSNTFVYLHILTQSYLSFEIPLALLFILGVSKSNCWNVIIWVSDSHWYRFEINLLCSQ